jgi:hypothetical protein
MREFTTIKCGIRETRRRDDVAVAVVNAAPGTGYFGGWSLRS